MWWLLQELNTTYMKQTMFYTRVVFHEDIVSAYVWWVVAGTGGGTGRAGGEV